MNYKFLYSLIFYFTIGQFVPFSIAQEITNKDIAKVVQDFKKDERGPYQAIRWFCPDGSVLPANQRCPQPGGIQHALHKDIVQKIAGENGIYLGQILAGTENESFLDAANNFSRLKQYLFESYLQSIDDGWILRRARYYRGAFQDEDENNWGQQFLLWLLKNKNYLNKEYFLIRQTCRILPHNSGDKRWENIRAVSKNLSDSIPSFINIRIKLHGQPEPDDIRLVQEFRNSKKNILTDDQLKLFDQLGNDLTIAFRPIDFVYLRKYSKMLPLQSPLAQKLSAFIDNQTITIAVDQEQIKKIIDIMMDCRLESPLVSIPQQRLALFDLSIDLESILFRELNNWKPQTLRGVLEKIYFLTKASAACGFLEMWEFKEIEPQLIVEPHQVRINVEELQQKSDYAKRVVEWGGAMVRATFQESLALFGEFEPMVYGFIDDRIRVSILLPFGTAAAQLADIFTNYAGIKQNVVNSRSQNQVRGLNAGYALGELVIVSNINEENVYFPDKIYVLSSTPLDLKPVAGLLTVSEGNLVSHVQLLARNLGIPNAVITRDNFKELSDFHNKEVFFAVSPKGTVLLKSAADMTQEEKSLVQSQSRHEVKISVPIDKLLLAKTDIINLTDLRASHSGKLTGPKAANLGQLKSLFPDNVVNGLVLPFGIYRQHMEQKMPSQNLTYWQFLKNIFLNAQNDRKSGKTDPEVEQYILQRLEILREAIKQMPFLPGFENLLGQKFGQVLGKSMGQIPVFIRSDTNMEDLKDFTGAGLNLTVFNVLEREKILQGIRDVWASPFSERSYRWRQRLLNNPENVFPSILIIPSVAVDKSGVLITTGVYSNNPSDITVAFNRGAGGAVEGQFAESYNLQTAMRQVLLSPGREKRYTILPISGGIEKPVTTFEKPILLPNEIGQLRLFANEIKKKLPGSPGIESTGPFDVELGFKDGKIWLFQVRPFVESVKAKSTLYLNKMDPVLDKKKIFLLDDLLKLN